jgi:hypothetical protein
MAEYAARAPRAARRQRPRHARGRAATRRSPRRVPHGIANFARRVAGPASPVIDQLASIDLPALVIVGEKDDAYLRAAEVLAARLPHAEHRTIAGAGHIVNLDAPRRSRPRCWRSSSASPVGSSATVVGMAGSTEIFTIETSEPEQSFDITARVREIAARGGVAHGYVPRDGAALDAWPWS